MDDRIPRWGDEEEDERRKWAGWADRQRTGWGTPGRWVESWLGPVRFPVAAVAIAIVFILFLAISYLAGDRALRGGPSAEAAVERVTEHAVHGLGETEAAALTYAGLMQAYAERNGLDGAEWTADVSGDSGYVRVLWRPVAGGSAPPIGFQVTDDRDRRVRVERLTMDQLQDVVRSVLGENAAILFRAAAGVS